ncbi:hypothetical protein SSX86_001791 [Deinandra increscens subsp. villosa]|uniref:Uncharacterized protein n=1 Tax=Deinandra increscens subsp. villosa TaxID=3103831 RepID=A0AAP0HCY4_9ASTR
MATMVKLISLLLFISMMRKDAYCEVNEVCQLIILQQPNHPIGSPRGSWNVWITNGCYKCSIGQLKLSCKGFNLSKKVDPRIISKHGDFCIVNNYEPIAPQKSVQFTYAAQIDYPFEVVHQSQICP